MLSFFKNRASRARTSDSPASLGLTDCDESLLQSIVDPQFYRYRYPDVVESGLDSREHFARYGWHENRDPNPFTHLAFVRKMYPDEFESISTLLSFLGGPICHNALLSGPISLKNLKATIAEGPKACSQIFVFDTVTYSENQKDVHEKSHLDTIHHLFYDGLYQNRLRAKGHLDPILVNVEDFSNDYEFLIAQERSLKHTEFSTLELSAQSERCDISDIKLGIGVIFYNNDVDEITRLVTSIERNLKGNNIHGKLHVWDNSPETLDSGILRKISPDLDIEFSAHPENPGFAKGQNGLMKECFSDGCTHFLGLNPDGYLLPGSILKALHFIKSKPVPALVELDCEPLTHPKWYHPLTGETDWVSGAAFILDAETYELTEGFDPDFPMYCEDVDLSFRAFQAGVNLFVAPNARYYHDTSYRLYTKENWRNARATIGLWYLCEKWGNKMRADFVLNHIMSLDTEGISIPARPEPMPNVHNKIQRLLTKERFSRSRFWGQ